jgi:hypothetical protein
MAKRKIPYPYREMNTDRTDLSLVSLSLFLAPQPSLGLGLLRNLLPLKMAEFLGRFSTIFFFTG